MAKRIAVGDFVNHEYTTQSTLQQCLQYSGITYLLGAEVYGYLGGKEVRSEQKVE